MEESQISQTPTRIPENPKSVWKQSLSGLKQPEASFPRRCSAVMATTCGFKLWPSQAISEDQDRRAVDLTGGSLAEMRR